MKPRRLLSTTRSTTLLLALVSATGCATDVSGDGNGDDEGDNDPDSTDPETQPVPTTPEGRFSVQSKFDLATNLPGTAGTIVNYFISATDDPDDPTKFIVDELIKALPSGIVKNTAQQAAQFVTGYLNDRLLEVAPDFVTRMLDLGDAFGQITKRFGTLEQLEVSASGQAVKTVQGLHFEIDNVDMDFAFKDHGIAETQIDSLMVGLETTGKLSISEHQVGLEYGQVLRLALDKAIIPMIDPSAQDLDDILHGSVNCPAVGQYVSEAVGIGSPSTFEAACNTGLTAAAAAFYNRLNSIDAAALQFGLTGTARGVDRNRDGKMDDIATGSWAGNLSYAGQPAPLAPATFFGKRM